MPRKGYRQSEEHKRAISEAKKGKPFSEEHLAAIREARKHHNGFKGHKRSPEAIEATRQALLGRAKTPDELQRQRAALRRFYEDPANRDANKERQRARWTGHKRKRRGYLQVWIPEDHPMASMRRSKGYVAEHRLVMAEHLGRPLEMTELVHHINFNRSDNRLENLQLMSRSEHMSLHNAMRFSGG